jgi:hypothetical protein
MLHNKRARALIVVLGLACAAVLAVTLVTRAPATQSVSSPNGIVISVGPGTPSDPAKQKDFTIPLNTPVFISLGGKIYGSPSPYDPVKTRAGWAVVFCNGTYWNWVGENSAGTIQTGRRLSKGAIDLYVQPLSWWGASVAVVNNSGGLRLLTRTYDSGPVSLYYHY